MIFFSELNLELIIDAELVRLSGCSLCLINMRRNLAPLPHQLASDELVDDNVLLEDLSVCHSSQILRSHFDERITNEFYM